MAQKPNLESLNEEEIRVLIGIQEKPHATYEELADITGIPKTVVFRTIKKLEDPSFDPPLMKVIAVPNLSNFGLELLDVIVEAETPKELEMTYNLCQSHPYLWYYTKCYGKYNGYYIQFRAPPDSIQHIQDLFTILKAKNYIKNFLLFRFGDNSIITHPQLKTWNYKNLSWNFKLDNWFKHDISDLDPPPQKKKDFELVHKWLKQRDIKLLNELLKNSRRKNSEIIEELKNKKTNKVIISPQTFSRDIKKIKANLIQEYRTEIHPESFDLLNPVLLHGIGKQEELDDLEKLVYHYPIPIHSTFKRTKLSVLWYLHISTVQLSDLMEKLRPKLQDLKFFFIDFPRSDTWLPEPTSFIEETKEWNVSEDYLISDVIKEMGEG
ncbi:MAG: winged helix-turn-helix transcriptional regulator [Promethearchaeota archaeon]